MIRRRDERTFAPRCAFIGALLAVSSTGSVARAQLPEYPPCTKKSPSATDVDAAKGAHKAATEFNDRGDYEKAIQYWRDAYGFDCTAHRLLINIANAYEKKGDKASAVASLEVYQQRTGGNDTAIAEKIANLKAALAAAPPPGPSHETTNEPTNGPATRPPTTAPGERPYGVKPWVVVVAGGVFVIVGGVLDAVGYSGISSAEAACPTHIGCTADAASQGNTGRVEVGLGWTAIAVGAAAVGGGLVWQFVLNKPGAGPKQGSTEAPLARVRVAPVLAPQRSGLAISGSF